MLARLCWLYVLLLFLILYLFLAIPARRIISIFKVYQNNLFQIFRVGRMMAVGDQSEITVSNPSKDVAMATKFCRFQRMCAASNRRLVAQSGKLTLGFVLHLDIMKVL